MKWAAAMSFAAAFASSGLAEGRDLPPGDYIVDGGWGSLTVEANGGFSIATVGANGHTCGLDGTLRGLIGAADLGDDPKDRCLIQFDPQPGGVIVTPKTDETCSAFCGARAHFDGLYLKPPKGCSDAEREATRKRFKSEYDAKSYAVAVATLTPLLSACARQLPWLDAAWIRNDLALARHRLGDDPGCLAVLKPLAEDAALTDQGLQEKFPPSDFEDYLPIVKAARANIALCRAAR